MLHVLLASQHPPGQVVGLHSQTPNAAQLWPETQATQTVPRLPQVASELVKQEVPEQQPEQPEVVSQTHALPLQR